MLIGELSHRTGVGPHLLRYYEAQGLLEPERGANGYREYNSQAIETVAQIRSLIGAGLSTEDIRSVLPCATGPAPDLEPCAELVDVLRARLAGLQKRIDTLLSSREALLSYIDATNKAAPSSTTPTCTGA